MCPYQQSQGILSLAVRECVCEHEGKSEREMRKNRHYTLQQSTVISLEEYVCHLPRLLPVLAGLQIVICWRQEFFYIKETVASSTELSRFIPLHNLLVSPVLETSLRLLSATAE